MKKNQLLSVFFGFGIVFSFITAPKALANSVNYPIGELGNCATERECFFYCKIPKNTPACWSYGKYTLPQVLGEATVAAQVQSQLPKITFPVPQLGNCASANACYTYCSQPQNQPVCMEFAHNHGLAKPEQSSVSPAILADAKTQLGCGSEISCKSLCSLPENFQKCQTFAQSHGLGPPPSQGVNPQIIASARIELGCDSESSCRSFCSNPENRTKCREFAKKQGLEKEETGMTEEKQKLIEEAKKELGCDSMESCSSFCSNPTNKDACARFSKKVQNSSAQSSNPQSAKPFNCPGDGDCRKYCGEHPDECPGYQSANSSPSAFQKSKIVGFGDFLGPSGCKSDAECKAYCEKHQDLCPGFPKPQTVSPSSQNATPPPTVGVEGKKSISPIPSKAPNQINAEPSAPPGDAAGRPMSSPTATPSDEE